MEDKIIEEFNKTPDGIYYLMALEGCQAVDKNLSGILQARGKALLKFERDFNATYRETDFSKK